VSGAVAVEYLERTKIQVRGAVTGRVYEFSRAVPLQHVDPRDAPRLLGTRFFRRVA
jgi:hypothetical protein